MEAIRIGEKLIGTTRAGLTLIGQQLKNNPHTNLELVVYCLYGEAAFDVFAKQLKDEVPRLQ